MVRAAYLRFASFATQALAWCSLPAAAFNRSGRVRHLVTRVVVAAVLSAAGTLKVWSLVEEVDFHSGWNYLTGLLAAGELLLGILLLSRQPGMVLWRACTLVFVVFACFSAYITISGAPTCGCFGNFVVPPVWILALDLALLAALVAFPPPVPETNDSQALRCTWAVRSATGLTFASLAIACSALASPAFGPAEKVLAPGVVDIGDRLVLIPSKWIGIPLPVLRFIGPRSEMLCLGDWDIWIIDPDCDSCARALLADTTDFDGRKRALVLLSQGSGESPLMTRLDDVVFFFRVPSGPEKRFVCPIPVRVQCSESIVTSVRSD